jgi:hypothetical protein
VRIIANLRPAVDYAVRIDNHALTQNYLVTNDGVWANTTAVADLRARADYRRWMDLS